MIPIYEQGRGNGIGHTIDSFFARFKGICREHVENGRAKGFALVLYDFTDRELRDILKNQGVFAELDRLSGKNLSVFYLHAGTRHAVERFNETLLATLELENSAELPCVVFFRLNEDHNHFQDVAVAQLDSADYIHGFHELYQVIERYIEGAAIERKENLRFLKWITSSTKFISVETIRAALRAAFGAIF